MQAPQPLRDQIVATIRTVTVDHNGCPVRDPISRNPAGRPEPAADVARLTEVSHVAACRYDLPRGFGDEPAPDPGLMSSVGLRGEAARRVVQAIAAGREGGGPNKPDSCLPEVSYGDEAIVVRATSAQGESRIYLRYNGCDHNGFDDGVAVRRLMRAAVVPLTTGANLPWSGSAATYELIHPGPPGTKRP